MLLPGHFRFRPRLGKSTLELRIQTTEARLLRSESITFGPCVSGWSFEKRRWVVRTSSGFYGLRFDVTSYRPRPDYCARSPKRPIRPLPNIRCTATIGPTMRRLFLYPTTAWLTEPRFTSARIDQSRKHHRLEEWHRLSRRLRHIFAEVPRRQSPTESATRNERKGIRSSNWNRRNGRPRRLVM